MNLLFENTVQEAGLEKAPSPGTPRHHWRNETLFTRTTVPFPNYTNREHPVPHSRMRNAGTAKKQPGTLETSDTQDRVSFLFFGLETREDKLYCFMCHEQGC